MKWLSAMILYPFFKHICTYVIPWHNQIYVYKQADNQDAHRRFQIARTFTVIAVLSFHGAGWLGWSIYHVSTELCMFFFSVIYVVLFVGISYWFFKWNQKWHVDEVDKRIPEIQGILEKAVRRSSCEKDPNKNRLFVYLKGDGIRYLSPSAIGTLYNVNLSRKFGM